MNQPGSPALPLEYAAQIVFELHTLRGECSEFAARVMTQRSAEESDLEECAQLEEALARAHQSLHSALELIKTRQAKRKPPRK